jgi:hypothetical protein
MQLMQIQPESLTVWIKFLCVFYSAEVQCAQFVVN